MDAARQAEQRAAVRHGGEAEAAIAVALDRRAAGIMGGADDDALGHGDQALPAASAASPASGSSVFGPPGLSLKKISTGAAM